MCGIKSIGNSHAETEKRVHLHSPSGDPLLHGLALQKLHGNEAMGIVLADFVDRADVGMIQRGSSARFAEKSFEGLLVAGNLIRKKLQGDGAAQRGVLGSVNHPHPAAAEFFDDAVMGHDLANEGIRRRHWPNILCFVSSQVNDVQSLAQVVVARRRTSAIPGVLSPMWLFPIPWRLLPSDRILQS